MGRYVGVFVEMEGICVGVLVGTLGSGFIIDVGEVSVKIKSALTNPPGVQSLVCASIEIPDALALTGVADGNESLAMSTPRCCGCDETGSASRNEEPPTSVAMVMEVATPYGRAVADEHAVNR